MPISTWFEARRSAAVSFQVRMVNNKQKLEFHTLCAIDMAESLIECHGFDGKHMAAVHLRETVLLHKLAGSKQTSQEKQSRQDPC